MLKKEFSHLIAALPLIQPPESPGLPIIGRRSEKELLRQIHCSSKPEFVAVYGRRRIGKTHLIRESFRGTADLFFYVSGQHGGKQADQLLAFKQSVEAAFHLNEPLPIFVNWREAFETLTFLTEAYIQKFAHKDIKSVVFFMDEFPWMATPRSNLLGMLDIFWNTRWSLIPQIRLFVCGSAATWIIRQILENTGGLHNRVTCQIRLEPFNLSETQEYLLKGGARSGKIKFTSSQILEIYLALGGIPAYLAHVQAGLSAAQNIGQLCFGRHAPLRDEFDRLFKSLFDSSEAHRKIVRALAKKRIGLTREEISQSTGLSSGGVLSTYLRELGESGFIEGYVPYLRRKNDKNFRLIDQFSWFYLKWIEPAPERSLIGDGIDYWLSQYQQPSYTSWIGYSFESLCLKHISHIKKVLRASQIPAKAGPWLYSEKTSPGKKKLSRVPTGAQVDLVLDRDDGVINLFEMKYSSGLYKLTAPEARQILQKEEIFAEQTKTKKQILPVLVTPHGLAPGPWNEEVFRGGVITLKNLQEWS